MNGLFQHIAATVLSIIGVGMLSIYAWQKFTKRDILISGVVLTLLSACLLIIESIYKTGSGGGYVLGFMIAPAWVLLAGGISLIAMAVFFADQREVEEELDEGPRVEELKPENDFTAFLRSKNEEFFDRLEDPVERGRLDAMAKDGPFPKTEDEKPKGYEANLRREYSTTGRAYLKEFIHSLKAGLRSSIKELAGLQKIIRPDYYASRARRMYNKTLNRVRPEDLRAAAQEHKEAEGQVQIFRDRCGLESGEPVDYGNRRRLLVTLITFLVVFLPAEVGISYWMLNESIGVDLARQVSIFAAMIIIVFAGAIGYAWQWTKRNQNVTIRTIAILSVILSTLSYLAVLGFIIAYRGDAITGQEAFKLAIKGYQHIFDSLGNLALFLLNIATFAIAVHESVHAFPRYAGWDTINVREIAAEEEWEDLKEQIRQGSEEAMEGTQKEHDQQQEKKDRLAADIKIKLNALKSISKDSIQAYGLVFSDRFEQNVNDYRRENTRCRSRLYPAPDYFDDIAPLVFDDIASEICDKELLDIPSDEEVAEALECADQIQAESGKWAAAQGQIRKAMNTNDKDLVDAAIQGREYRINPEVNRVLNLEEN